MRPILVGEYGKLGFAQAVDPDPHHPSWSGVWAFLHSLPDIERWTFYVSPAADTRTAIASRTTT